MMAFMVYREPTFVPKSITCHRYNEKFTPSDGYAVEKRGIPRYKCPSCGTKPMLTFIKGGRFKVG